MKRGSVLYIIFVFILLGILFSSSDVMALDSRALELNSLPETDYQFLDYTDTQIIDKINTVLGLNDAILEIKEYAEKNNMYYIISFGADKDFKKFFEIKFTFFKEKPNDLVLQSWYSTDGRDPRWNLKFFKKSKSLMTDLYLYNSGSSTAVGTGGTDFLKNKEIIKKFIDEKPSCGGAATPGFCGSDYNYWNYGAISSNKTNNFLDFSKPDNHYFSLYLPIYSNFDIKLELKEDIDTSGWNNGYNLPLFFRVTKDGKYRQIAKDEYFTPFFQEPTTGDEVPENTDDEKFTFESDLISYYRWNVDLEKVYSDFWFDLDDVGNYGLTIKYRYVKKDSEKMEEKEIKLNDNRKYLHKFSKSFINEIKYLDIDIKIPYQINNTRYDVYFRNGAIMNEQGQIADNIFKPSSARVERGKYKTIDMTSKYAVQLFFKKPVNSYFDYIEFHTLGEFNYYFKKQYGQSADIFDNSQSTDYELGLTTVWFEGLGSALYSANKDTITLFFVNNNFKNNNTIRTLLSYDSDMFDVVVFENEWDNKDFVTPGGDNITLEPPANINPDGSEESNDLLGEINIENILNHSFDAMKNIIKVFGLLGNFVTALLLSFPPIFQTVLLWGFTVGVVLIVIKTLL